MKFHVKQRGFTLYIVLAAILAFSGMGIALKVQSSRLDACKEEYAKFRLAVKAKGEAAIMEAKRIESENQAKKEKIDRENKTLRANNSRLAGELRNARASSGFVPKAATGSRNPELATFNRSELERTIQHIDAGVSAIVAEGDQARIDLDSVREWARR